MFKKSRFLLVPLMILAVSALANAQIRVTGVIQGTVTDEQKAPLPGVSMSLTSPSLMTSLAATTDKEGKYRFVTLPTGAYTVEASLPGFTPTKITDIDVHAGMTATIDVKLTAAKVSTEVVVIGEKPLIDTSSAAVATQYLTKDFLENIPTSRDTFRLINALPGVTYLSAYGSGESTGNLYQMDGVQITDSWFGGGIYSSPIDYDIIEEQQFVALGAPAEYGNFSGATVNFITKSGGNSFSGDVHLYFSGEDWHSSNVDPSLPDWQLLSETPATSTTDAAFHLGGPIIKNKLWFFGGFNYFRQTIKMVSLDMSSPLTFPKSFLKMTYQLDEKNKFNASVEYHNSTQKNMTFSPLVPPEANYAFSYPVWIGNFSYLHLFSDQTVLDVKLSGNHMFNDYIPNSGQDVPGHYDLATGASSVNSTWYGHWLSERYELATALTNYSNLIKGSHVFKFGVEVEKAVGGGTSSPTGGVAYNDFDGEPFYAVSSTYKSWGVNWRYTGYVQDDWKITNALVISPGLRYTFIRGSIPDLNATVYKPQNFEPRFGIVLDLSGKQTTVLKAHYGKYYEGTKSYYFSSLQPSPDTIYYTVNPDWSLVYDYTIFNTNAYSIDPNIKHPSMDQVVAGLEQVIGGQFTLSVTGIYRYWRNFIEPVNTTAVFETISFTDPASGQVFEVYNQTNPGDNHYYITNPKVGADYGQADPNIVTLNPWREYTALEFSLNKRLSDRWQFSVSYLLSKEHGTYGDSHNADNQRGWMGHQTWNMAMSSLYKDPNAQINLLGRSIISSPHVIKVMGTYIFPYDVTLSAFYSYAGGRRWEQNVVLTMVSQYSYLMTEPRGSRGLKAMNNLDMRLAKNFTYRGLQLSLMFDMFNVFNQARATQIMDVEGTNFGQALNVNQPRTYRASILLHF
jgi:hypothetical protein